MSDIYLSLTETPTVVTLSQPVIGSSVAATVTVANTVTVALDANSLSALEQVTVTVGAAVSVSNFPATQVVSVSNFPASSSVTIANFPSVTTVAGTVALDSASLIALENVTVTVGAAVTIAGFSTSILPPSTVTVGNSVTIGNFPSTQTIAGTVTANVPLVDATLAGGVTQGVPVYLAGGKDGVVIDEINYINSLPAISGTVTVGNSVTIGSLPAISGTVTANGGDFAGASGDSLPAKYVLIAGRNQNNQIQPLGVSADGKIDIPAGIETEATIKDGDGNLLYFNNGNVPISGTVTVGSSVTIGSLPAISGTVTANVASTTVTISGFPRTTWTDYSGSVVTANSSVTAISTITRSYLLAQVTTGQMFLNIGATCTTSNGVYFSAGQGFAWETCVPQGIVSIISGVTGTNYVLKDG